MAQGYEALTDREKQTLRLLLVGHDAKSMARHFGLSVHTINERLRDARRKLAVSSSKEAARRLYEIEGTNHQTIADTPFGDVAPRDGAQVAVQPDRFRRFDTRAIWFGGLVMTSLLAALLAMPAAVQAPAPASQPVMARVNETAVTQAARNWLALLDGSKWQESWAATTGSFQSLNTAEAWQSASEKARKPLGRALSRTLLSEQDTPAPPNGYKVVRFRTDFANKGSAVETLSLDQEGDVWKVAGIYIE